MCSAFLALGLAAVCIVVAAWMAIRHFSRSFVDKDKADQVVKKGG